ncbi:hypothetical protein [Hyphobacterium sp.]|jgi:predicted ATP-grasp superfamily ATP-dependent carboligase|uniref:ATP-binding protein n=1 Tax=Hyphobacterium sp. TaxID=2004662 RepID=UPI003BAB8BC8
MSGILLIDHNRCSLAVARAMAGRGRDVYAGIDGPCDYLNLSRFVTRSLTMADLVETPERALADLNRIFAAYPEITGLFPVDETGVRFLTDHGAGLPDHVLQYVVAAETVRRVTDKSRAAKLAADCGIPVAPRITVDNFADLKSAAADIGFPLVVRAVECNHDVYGVKVLVCHDRATFDAVCTDWPTEGHKQLMIQRYNAGGRHNLYWTADRGRLHAGVNVEVGLTTAGDASGYGTFARTIEPVPELADYATRLVEALGYHGTGSAQFLLDKQTGEITFLEINPRLGANSKLVESVLPYIDWFADLVEGTPLAHRPDPWAYKRGQRFVWLKGENQTYKKLLREKRYGQLVSRFGLSLWNSVGAVHGVFSPDDPLPALACHFNPVIRHLPKRLLPRLPQPVPEIVVAE